MKQKKLTSLIFVSVLSLSSCTKIETGSVSATTSALTTVMEDTSGMFTDVDVEIGYDSYDSVNVVMDGSSITVTGTDITTDDNTITIHSAGTYIFQGTLTEGQIVVDAEENDMVQIVLDSVTIVNEEIPAIEILNAGQVVITTAQGTVNTLETISSEASATINSQSDLTCNGLGTLVIHSERKGIYSEENLKLTSGTYEVNATDHALAGKESVRIANGTYVLNAGADGIHSESEDKRQGYVYIASGTFTIIASDYGIYSNQEITISSGTLEVISGKQGILAMNEVVINENVDIIELS